MMIRTLVLAAAVAGTGCNAAALGPPDADLSILFVGNSLTYTNDLPGMLERMLEAYGDVGEVHVESVAFPNFGLPDHWAEGSAGTEDLARHVVALADSGVADFQPLYPDEMPLWEKIETVATKLYGAAGVSADDKVKKQIDELQGDYGHLPVCMAKTQYSFSTDPELKGAPEGHRVNIREVRLSAGAGFLVAVAGDIMTMPGLPRVPAANNIYLNDDGQIEGLF